MAASTPQFVTLEEHFVIPALANAVSPTAVEALHPGVDYAAFATYNVSKLLSVGAARIADMDEGSVAMQVVSHAPLPLADEPTTATCVAINDTLAAAAAANPARLAAFAALNMRDPPAAAAELRRRVGEQGFRGALLDDHTPDGRRYDDAFFWPVFAAAQELDAPIYLHPGFPPGAAMADTAQLATSAAFRGNYGAGAAALLSAPALNWHTDTAMHVLRLFVAGVFEAFPRLKLVIGHDGEGLPFFLERTERVVDRLPVGKDEAPRTRPFRTVWNENIWITTAGMMGLAPMACMLRNVKHDRILLSIDYPFSPITAGKQFMEDLWASGMVTREQWEAIGWGNAKKLLKL